jgi:hypothetical protein
MDKKLDIFQIQNNQNKNELDNVQKIPIKINADIFLKKIIEIPIIMALNVSAIDSGGEGG